MRKPTTPPNHGEPSGRVCARIEATELGLDIRYVVTNIATGSAEHIYDNALLARSGQMENLTNCTRANWRRTARLPGAARQSDAAHSAHRAYWLMLELRDAIPKPIARRRRICNLARKASQDRRAHHRDRNASSLRSPPPVLRLDIRYLAAPYTSGAVERRAETVPHAQSTHPSTPTRSKCGSTQRKTRMRNCVRIMSRKKIASARRSVNKTG